MATVSTSLKMFDEMTKPLQQITQALNLTISAMDSLSSSSSRDIGITNTLNAARHSTNRASAALHQLAISQNEAANEQENLNDSIDKSSNFIEKLTEKLRDKFESFKEEYLTIEKAFDLTIGGAARLEQQINTVSSALGNKGAGKQFFKGLTDHANQSAYSLEEFTGISMEFMKVTKDTDKLMNLNKSAEKLSLVDPTQGLEGSASAIKEALAGDYGALMDNFGFEGADQEFLESSSGIDDFINKFDEILNAKGATEQALEEVNNSAIAQLDNLKSNIQTSFAEAGYGALQILKPILSTINEAFQQGRFQPVFDSISNGLIIISTIAKGVADAFCWIGEIVLNNWSFIGPLIWGLVAGIIAYNAVMGIAWLATLKTTIVKGIHAIASGIETLAIIALIIAQDGLNAALAACPITWIITAIVVVIAVLIAWMIHTNGLKATWLMFTNVLLTAWDMLKISAYMTVYGIMNMWDSLCMACYQLAVSIQNALGDMRAGGLMILQDFVNGAIDLINDLISHVNKIPGVSIDAISKVTFGTKAMAENQLEKSARNKALDAYKADKNAAMKKRQDDLDNMINKADADLAKRRADIAAAKEDHKNNPNTFKVSDILDKLKPDSYKNDTANTIKNPSELLGDGSGLGSPGANGLNNANNHLKNIDDKMDVSNEHLEMMRDLAEQESVQNFVTLTPTVQVTTGDIKEEADINTIISRIETYMENELVNSAEGVYA
ncbi:hypothetical protein [Clostridium sp. Marseille-QA1073]